MTLDEKLLARLKQVFIALLLGAFLAVCVWMVRAARAEARDAFRLANIARLQTALELYFAEQNSYPVVAQPALIGAGIGAGCLSAQGFAAANCSGDRVYMPSIAGNVTPGGITFRYISRTASGEVCTGAPCASYSLDFALEGTRGTYAKGNGCARPTETTAGICR